MIDRAKYTLNAYYFNSKHSKCMDTYEKNGADLYGMLHYFLFCWGEL